MVEVLEVRIVSWLDRALLYRDYGVNWAGIVHWNGEGQASAIDGFALLSSSRTIEISWSIVCRWHNMVRLQIGKWPNEYITCEIIHRSVSHSKSLLACRHEMTQSQQIDRTFSIVLYVFYSRQHSRHLHHIVSLSYAQPSQSERTSQPIQPRLHKWSRPRHKGTIWISVVVMHGANG